MKKELLEIYKLLCKVLSGKIEYLVEAREAKAKLERVISNE